MPYVLSTALIFSFVHLIYQHNINTHAEILYVWLYRNGGFVKIVQLGPE